MTRSLSIGQDRRVGTRALRVLGLALALAIVLTSGLVAAKPAHAISRNTVLSRAQTWMDVLVPYSQTKYYKGYRQDCSGYVSMCWQTGFSYSTRSFHTVASRITTAQLLPGDAIHKVGHIRLFYGWLDDSHTLYVCYEQTGPTLKSSIRAIADDLAAGYHPCRYRHIENSAPTRNLLRNPSFDVWFKPWGTTLQRPVWWTIDGSNETTVGIKHQDTAKSGKNSWELMNPSDDPATYTVMSQTVTVTPDTTYAVSAWVRSTSDPGALRASVDYLDPVGASVARLRSYGTSWPLPSTSFKRVTFALRSPLNAVRAKVVVRLAGGTTTVGTATVPGTRAILDDVTLLRPYTAISIARSRSTGYIGTKVHLSGVLGAAPSVVTTVAAGRHVDVMVLKPGATKWERIHGHTTYMSGSSAIWKCAYTFRRGMKKGVYRFKVDAPAFGDFLGSSSSAVSVRLR